MPSALSNSTAEFYTITTNACISDAQTIFLLSKMP